MSPTVHCAPGCNIKSYQVKKLDLCVKCHKCFLNWTAFKGIMHTSMNNLTLELHATKCPRLIFSICHNKSTLPRTSLSIEVVSLDVGSYFNFPFIAIFEQFLLVVEHFLSRFCRIFKIRPLHKHGMTVSVKIVCKVTKTLENVKTLH